MAVLIDSGPVEAEDFLRHVPRDKWRELMLARRRFLEIKLSHDCRCLVQFVNDAEAMFEALGFESAEQMIREGYGLEPKEIEIAVEWLKLNQPDEPVPLKVVLRNKSGRPPKNENTDIIRIKRNEHGTSRKAITARLDRDHPELAERVRVGELSANAAAIEAGFRKKQTPFEKIVKLIPKLSVSERDELRRML